jgi:hypothetical protein
MAALSVQYSNLGMKVFHSCASPISCKLLRRPLLALTPPAMQMLFTPVCCTAFFTFFRRILMMVYCIEAQRSSRLAAIKPGSCFCRKYSTDVFNPLKRKIQFRHLRLCKFKTQRVAILRMLIDQWPAGIWEAQQFRTFIKCFTCGIIDRFTNHF